jgi:hypothetical protein
MPFGTAFTSNAWLDEPEGDQDIGEVPGAPRVWQDGTAPYPVAGDGHFCGTEEDFQQGGLVPPTPPTLNDFGGLACCPTPPEPYLYFGCHAWPNGVWSEYTLIVTGATGVWAGGNGTFEMRFRHDFLDYPGCNWVNPTVFGPAFPPGRATWIMAETSGGTFHPLAIYPRHPATDYGFFYSLAGWTPLRLYVAPIVLTGVPTTVPPFVVVVPGIASAPGAFCPAQGGFLPRDLLIRSPAPVLGIGNSLDQQDAPFVQTAACVYTGTLLWLLPRRLFMLGRLQTSATITFGLGGLVTLAGRTPSGIPYSYTASLPAWDSTPAGLVLTASAGLLGGLPLAVTLYQTGDLPP